MASHRVSAIVLSLLLCLAGCRSADRRLLQGMKFEHALLAYRAPASGGILHVYIEGDGNPWLRAGVVAADPTARRLVTRELMALDPHPAVLLGRPCYHQVRSDGCEPSVWTHGRYSEEVVDSMAAALRRLLVGRDVRPLFIGHSGGGVLAVLLSRRFSETAGVVTLAANLDLAGWSGMHGFTPLTASLDPLAEGVLPFPQMHFAAADDANVPARMVDAAARRLGGAARTVPGDHSCCWAEIWPAVLAEIDAFTAARRMK
jgi:pimeloyl-ACP methyl ester carboxylesterase